MSTAVEERLTKLWETPKTIKGMLGTVDHKDLGRRYVVTALIFLVLGGVEALLMRLQLTGPQKSWLTPEMYDQIFTMHGMTMIWWYASPILSGLGVFLIPLLGGARDLAYPRLNAFTYWAYVFSGILLYISPILEQAPHDGWYAFAPYSNLTYSPAHGMDIYNMALLLLTISTTGNAINFIVSILRLRCPGMSISKWPFFYFSSFTTSVVTLFAMPALTACNIFLELDRRWHTQFFEPHLGGNPLLWQQLFWFFGHPWVYIVFLPATGMMSMIIPIFSRRPLVGYPYVAASTVLTGLVGFGVWVHHMFVTGMSHLTMSFFSAASMTISIFTVVQVFAWVATMWKGKPVMTASMHFAVGFIALIVIGGLNGVASAVLPLDWQITETYWIVSHIHYVLVGANMFPVFSALYFWVPKMTGKMMSERLGKISFWITFVGFNVAFFTMQILGVEGMPRRIYTYLPGLGWGPLNLVVTIGAFVLGFGILLTFINFFWSLKHGKAAGRNPWFADTLEWDVDSPPKPYGSVHIPTVITRHPLWDEHDESEDPNGERILDQGRLTFTTGILDGRIISVARMPKDTLKPMFVAVGLFVLFGALAYQMIWLVCVAIVFTIIITALWLRVPDEPEPELVEPEPVPVVGQAS